MDGQLPKLEVLTKNLTRQITLYKEMLTVVRGEKEHLIKVNVRGIQEATFAKEVLLVELQSVEHERRRWVLKVGDHFQKDPDDLDIESILPLYRDENREKILRLRNTLKVLIHAVKDMGLDNQRLVANALRESQAMKENALGISNEKAKVYGPKGGIEKRDNTARIFSSKV